MLKKVLTFFFFFTMSLIWLFLIGLWGASSGSRDTMSVAVIKILNSVGELRK